MWSIPEAQHAPLNQDAIVISKSERQPLAKKFLDFLRKDPAAIQTIRTAGYALPKR
jgi:molybdate transport system substrate-binding protein